MKLSSWLSISAVIGVLIFYGFKDDIIVNATFPPNQYIIVTLTQAKVVDKNGIGNEWFFYSTIENTALSKGVPYSVNLTGKSEIKLISKAIEEDPSSDDIGTNTISITPESLKKLVSTSEVSCDVFVKEYFGKGKGKTATCKFTYEISIVSKGLTNL